MGRLRGTRGKGLRVSFPYDMWINTVSSEVAMGSAQTIDASGEYVDFQFQAEEAKEIASFMARFGSVTVGSTVTPFELNNIDETGTQPSFPGATVHASGTIDTLTVSPANTSKLFTFGTAYTPTAAQKLAAKIAHTGVQNLQIVPTTDKGAIAFPFVHTFLGGAHAVRSNLPVFGVEYSDGTWMRIPWCYPISAVGNTGFNSGSASTEYGMKLRLPMSMWVDTINIFCDADDNDTFDLIIYGSDRANLSSVSVSGELSSSVLWGPRSFRLATPVHMRAGKDYFVVARATSATSINIQYMDAFEAAAMNAFLGNANCFHVNRTHSGDPAFTENTTRKVLVGVEGYALAA